MQTEKGDTGISVLTFLKYNQNKKEIVHKMNQAVRMQKNNKNKFKVTFISFIFFAA